MKKMVYEPYGLEAIWSQDHAMKVFSNEPYDERRQWGQYLSSRSV